MAGTGDDHVSERNGPAGVVEGAYSGIEGGTCYNPIHSGAMGTGELTTPTEGDGVGSALGIGTLEQVTSSAPLSVLQEPSITLAEPAAVTARGGPSQVMPSIFLDAQLGDMANGAAHGGRAQASGGICSNAGGRGHVGLSNTIVDLQCSGVPLMEASGDGIVGPKRPRSEESIIDGAAAGLWAVLPGTTRIRTTNRQPHGGVS